MVGWLTFMVDTTEPRILSRVESVDEELGEITKRSGYEFIRIPIGDILNEKYAHLDPDRKYAIMVSSNLVDDNSRDYNFILTITSRSNDVNKQVLDNFSKKTGVDLRMSLSDLAKVLNGIDIVAELIL